MPRVIKSIKMEDLLKLTKVEFVYNRLNRANVSPEVRTRIVHAWQARKAEEKAKLRYERTITQPWLQLLALFRAECARANTALHHCDPTNMQKMLALHNYLDCLRRHRDRIKLLALTSAGRTPRDYAVAKKLPNNGALWPDWIDPTERTNITLQFNSLPPVEHGRPFVVFRQSNMAPSDEARIKKLKDSIERAIRDNEYKRDTYPAHRAFHDEALRGLRDAQDTLNKIIIDRGAWPGRLPSTYFALLSQEHRDALVQINRPTDGRRKPPEKTADEKLFD